MTKLKRSSSSSDAGLISAVHDCGTIIIVYLSIQRHRIASVFFDHRQFRAVLAREACTPTQLIGRPASFDGEIITLLD